ncbi:MAG: Endo/excinuclease amino terminal domain protein [Parcubacteria group bacterium GW2011_GWB1_41_4]|nr:MAG: Endo/excinuclease amino terminal domain protein [Parcubacteria group bacterium GW2011_GWB1_41_4]
MREMKYFVYILECADKTFYTGITNDLKKRLKDHADLKAGAKYTKSRRPVRLVYSEVWENKNLALKREASIKLLTHQGKLTLITK